MKGMRLRCLFISVCSSVLLFACYKKSSVLDETTRFTANVSTQAGDEARMSYEIDAMFNDANTVLAQQSKLTGKTDTLTTGICNATVIADVVDTPNNIQLYYRGNTCDNSRYRWGQIGIYYTPGTQWTTANDTVYLLVTNLAVTRSDGQIIVLNGTYAYNNVSGGSLSTLSATNPGPIVHTITGTNVGFNFSDSVHTTWQVGRKRTYTYSNSGIVITTTGADTTGGLMNVSGWGGNRYGNSVITTIAPSAPLVISSGCNWELMSGQVTLTNPIGVTNVTYGLDSTGKATGCPLSGVNYYYQAAWSGSGEDPVSLIKAYY
jgi:hypothetical protein